MSENSTKKPRAGWLKNASGAGYSIFYTAHSILRCFGHRKYASAQNLFHHVGYAIGIIQRKDISLCQVFLVDVGVGSSPPTV